MGALPRRFDGLLLHDLQFAVTPLFDNFPIAALRPAFLSFPVHDRERVIVKSIFRGRVDQSSISSAFIGSQTFASRIGGEPWITSQRRKAAARWIKEPI